MENGNNSIISFKISAHCKTPDNQQLYLSVNEYNQVVVKTNMGNDAAQLWQRVQCQADNRAYIINMKTNTCIHIERKNAPVTLVPIPSTPDSSSLWNFGGRAIQSAQNSNWNLNVRGDKYPDGTVVIAWNGWEGHSNECWDWIPFYEPNPNIPEESDVIPHYKISPRCKTPNNQQLYLTVDDKNGTVVVKTDLGNDTTQWWKRIPCCDEKGRYGTYIVNVKTNTCIHINGKNCPVSLAPIPNTPDNGCLWNICKNAIQSAQNNDWNLNVRGDRYPDGTSVIAWEGWQEHSNECWDWIPSYTPALKSLSILTYNTHLFEGSLASFAAEKFSSLISKKIVYEDKRRAKAIVYKIIELNPDIVCLQEVWGEQFRQDIKNCLSDIYPYVYITPGQDVSDNDIPDILQEIPDQYRTVAELAIKSAIAVGALPKLNNGLFIASKYSLLNCSYEAYNNMTDSEDKLGKKGFITFSIEVPISSSQFRTITIGTTHAPTTPSEAYEALADAAKSTFRDRMADSILLGDFNLHYYRTDDQGHTCERDTLDQKMKVYEASDVIAQFLPNSEDCYTDWPYGNTLTAALGDKPATDNGKERIDYVYFSQALTANSELIPAEAHVYKDWTINDTSLGNLDLSDHNPVFVKFNFK